ncbi:MAG TPA: hypothetical protein VK158_04835 [Acidobacteriota bacterium]|nr:hypothetical protein [Acidobacteriota bacterium]
MLRHVKHHHVHFAYAFLLFAVLLLYAGCSARSSGTPSDYRTGSEALRINFMSNNQHVFYDGDEMVLLFEASNKGTGDIDGGQFYLSGFDPNYLSAARVEPSEMFSLEGKDQYNPTGEFSDVYTIRADVKSPENRNRFPQSVMVTACYEYETIASAEVCIDPDPSNRRLQEKVCTTSTRGVGAQGHPVVVTSVEPIVGKDSIRFNIRFANSGSGQVFDPRLSNDDCAMGLDYNEVDRVVVDYVSLGGKNLDCSYTDSVRLINGGSGLISCTCDKAGCIEDPYSAYWSILEIGMRYGYKNVITTDVTILKE